MNLKNKWTGDWNVKAAAFIVDRVGELYEDGDSPKDVMYKIVNDPDELGFTTAEEQDDLLELISEYWDSATT